MDQQRSRVYITSLLTTSSLAFVLAAFAIIKDKLNTQLNIQEGFLGLLDSLMFFGRFFGCAYVLLFPSQEPKKNYFIACTFASLFQLLIPLSVLFGHNGKYSMLVGMLGAGFCRGFIMIPFLFLSEIFNQQKDKPKLTIWTALSHFGDVLGIFFAYITVYQLQMKWPISYVICVLIYFFLALTFYLSVQQKKFSNQKDEDITSKQKILKCYEVVKFFYSYARNFLWGIDYCLQAIFMTIIIFWFPYYFVQNGFGFSSTFITVAFYISSVLGTFVFQAIVHRCQHIANYVCAAMLSAVFLTLTAGTIFLSQQKGHSTYYLVMLTMIGFLIGGVSKRIGCTDFLELVGQDKQTKYYAIFFERMVLCLFSIIVMIFVGHMMQTNQRNLFYILIGIILASLVIYITRKFLLIKPQSCTQFDPLEQVQVDHQLNSLQ